MDFIPPLLSGQPPLAVPYDHKCHGVDYCMPLGHITERATNLPQSGIATFCGAGVDEAQLWIMKLVKAQHTCLRAPYMTFGMKAVNEKYCVLKELRLPCHAVRCKSTREIINNVPRCHIPVAVKSGEHVISAFAFRDDMKAEANHMGTPRSHDSACETMNTVGLVVFRTTDSCRFDFLGYYCAVC